MDRYARYIGHLLQLDDLRNGQSCRRLAQDHLVIALRMLRLISLDQLELVLYLPRQVLHQLLPLR